MKEKKCSCIRYQDYIAEEIDINTSYSDYLKEGLENAIKYANYSDYFSDEDYCDNCYPLEVIENKIQEILKKVTELDYREQLLIDIHNKRISINRQRHMDFLLDDIQFVECDIRELEDFKRWRNNINYAEYVCENLEKSISYAEYLSEQIN
jgi:hypothetical protein